MCRVGTTLARSSELYCGWDPSNLLKRKTNKDKSNMDGNDGPLCTNKMHDSIEIGIAFGNTDQRTECDNVTIKRGGRSIHKIWNSCIDHKGAVLDRDTTIEGNTTYVEAFVIRDGSFIRFNVLIVEGWNSAPVKLMKSHFF